jgi:hypothetical protein
LATLVTLPTKKRDAGPGRIVAVVFPAWATYGSAMQAITADPDYQRLLVEASKQFELQDRFDLHG